MTQFLVMPHNRFKSSVFETQSTQLLQVKCVRDPIHTTASSLCMLETQLTEIASGDHHSGSKPTKPAQPITYIFQKSKRTSDKAYRANQIQLCMSVAVMSDHKINDN